MSERDKYRDSWISSSYGQMMPMGDLGAAVASGGAQRTWALWGHEVAFLQQQELQESCRGTWDRTRDNDFPLPELGYWEGIHP